MSLSWDIILFHQAFSITPQNNNMGVTHDMTNNSYDLEDSGNFTWQCSSDSYEDCSSPESVFEYTSPNFLSRVCFGCGGYIEDQYILQLDDRFWHPACLRCSHCHVILENHRSCFVRDGKIYCRKEEYGIDCSRCQQPIRSDDWIRKARDNFYHLNCFSCEVCNRQLSTGEQFALCDNRLLCKIHYMHMVQGFKSIEGGQVKRKAKRMRTAFTEEQVQIFQSFFNVEQNPDPQDLDTIAEQTGVSRRVAQVWFQNARARSKKHVNTSPNSGRSSSSELSLDEM